MADRAKAVECYLAYLERVPKEDTARQAWVYGRLGALYAVAINPLKGEQPDREKARQYFLKVLELEPRRIGRPTIAARAHLAGMAGPTKARLAAFMDLYAWLQKIDEQACVDRWLPTRPDRAVPDERELKGLVNLCEGARSMAQTNMISLAGSRSLAPADRVAALKQIMERFPGTEAADLAQKALAKLDPSVQPPVQEPPATPLAPGPPVKRLGASRLIAEPNGLALSGKPITLSAAPRQPVQESAPLATAAEPVSGRWVPWWLPGLGVAVLILAVAAMLRHRRSPAK